MLGGLFGLAVGLSGCAVNRPTLKTEQLAAVRERYLIAVRADSRTANEKMLARMKGEQEGWLATSGERPTFDILVLSGGGDYGAFGAGFLQGWGKVRGHQTDRPVFDMVTGVSTGALIAPFAFIGDDPSYERVVKLYSSPSKSWFQMRGLLFFLPGNESFMDSAGLRRDLEKVIDADVVCRLADASRDNRVLAVNTTNLDVGAMHPFEVSVEAERAEQCGDRKRLIDILMASAAIPAAFPPVVIDGALYVDGGTTSNILYGSNWLSPKAPIALWHAAYPDQKLPRIRFWVIVNNQLNAAAQIVQPTWMSITKASIATAIRSSTSVALRHLSTQCLAMCDAGVEAEFRYVCIPMDWIAPNANEFDKDVMESLATLGMKMGADPESWRGDFKD